MINKCNFCDKIHNKVFAYLCVECNNNTNYCEICNPVMERIFSRQFFHCVFCDQIKQIKTINILNNKLNNESLINDNSTNKTFLSAIGNKSNNKLSNNDHNDKNKLFLHFGSKNPIDKKLEFLENLAEHLNKNLQISKSLNESHMNPFKFDNSIHSNFGGLSLINPNSTKNNNIYNSTLLNEASPHKGAQSYNVSNTFNSLLNAFSPIKNKEASQFRFINSAVSQRSKAKK